MLRRFWLALVLGATAVAGWSCGGRRGLPPDVPPVVRGPDGKDYHLVVKGPYKAYYDLWGQLRLLEFDSNGDGRPDRISHHDGQKVPRLIEIDEDFDGHLDRWEEYDSSGKLVKIGVSRKGKGPDLWSFLGPDGQSVRREYDEDGDGKVDRAEVLEGGRIVRIEIDTDRDGRMDRWQNWRQGRLLSEELDIDADGKPDRRLRFGSTGKLQGVEPLPHG